MSKVLGIDALTGIRDWVKSEDDAVKAELRTYFGSPLVASTVAGMTDQTKVYVYTGSETGYTAGNWYYYNGSAWTSGGVYNSAALETDPTLTIEGMAADAKATGDEIALVKQDNTNYAKYVVGKENLLLGAMWTTGAYISESGVITPYATAKYTSLIPITDDVLEYYYLATTNGTVTRVHGYDSSGNWVAQITTENTGATATVKSFGIYAHGYSYIRISESTTMTPIALYNGLMSVNDKIDAVIKDINSRFLPNLMGYEPNVKYPVYIKAGDSITLSTSDGSSFPINSTLTVMLYDHSGTQTDYFSLKNGESSKVIITDVTRADTYFLAFNQLPTVPLMVVYGSIAASYKKYRGTLLTDLEMIENTAVRPHLRNGSVGNMSNPNQIATSVVLPTYGARQIKVTADFSLTSDVNNYYWIVWTYSRDGLASGNATYKLKEYDPYQVSPSNSIVFNIDPNVNGIAVSVTEATPTGNAVAHRIETDGDSFVFRYIYDVPDDTTAKLDNARHVLSGANTPLTLLHFSDLHADTDALARIIRDSGKYGKKIDDVICTGDMTYNTAEQISSWWNPRVLTCIGNHDTASYSEGSYNWTALSMANRDAYYIAPFESNWGIIHTSGTSYYYKDYTTQKVRLIVMDGMLYTGTPGTEATNQNTWLAGLLANAITAGLHVLIAIHAPHGGATPTVCTFTEYGTSTMPTWNDCNTPQAVIDAVATAIANGLNFIGYIVGHTHRDVIWDAENNKKQLMYCITTANVKSSLWVGADLARDNTKDAFNLVTIDTSRTLIKIVRGGGANISDHMIPREAICFNYSTGDKVGEVL